MKKIFSGIMAAVIAFSSAAAITVSAAEEDTFPKYKRTDAFNSGEQGTGGWYFKYEKSEGEYVNMTHNTNFDGVNGAAVDLNFIVPGKNTPAVVAWEAPYTGTVTLTEEDGVVYRNGPNVDNGGGDVTATLTLNGTILTDDTDNKTQWVFDNTCYNGGETRKSYTVTGLHVNKGDVLYHKVDCGENTTGAGIYWKPIVTYTECEIIPDGQKEFERTVAYPKGVQGYHGWYYLNRQQGSSDYVNLNWDGNYYKASNGAYVNEHFIMGGNNAPTAIAWKAPYSGTVKLSASDNIVYRSSKNESGANVTAVIKINDRTVTLDNGNAAQWTFDNSCDHDNGAISYTIQNLHVNKGDIIYHEVDCGTNLTSADIFWKPIVEYTAFDNTSYKQTTSPAITGSDNATGFVTTIEATDNITTISKISWNVTSGGTTKLLTPEGSCPITTLENGATVSFKVIVKNLKDNAATAVAVVE